MNQWRAPYFPPQYEQNQQMMPPDYQFPNPSIPNQPSQQPFNMPQQPMNPYQHFVKPQQPTPWEAGITPMSGVGPNQSWNQKPNGLMTYFQDKNGQLDVDKMLNTVGQAANTFQQVSPLVKGIGSFMKGFK